MARRKFYPNVMGYRDVMNSHNEVMDACQRQGMALAGAASAISGIDYMVDSITGINRVHTRVSTVTLKDFFRERHYHALSAAVGAAGGHVKGVKGGGYRSVQSRVASSRRSKERTGKDKGWRAPSYRKKSFRR